MSDLSPDERRRRAAKGATTRAAAITNTPPTTRPGSETTDLTVGDLVRAARTTTSARTWARHNGRTGTVVAINAQTFPSGVTYVEVGVAWNPQRNLTKASADVWFRVDELEPVT